ncbi:SAF domain-containing protein [Jatrophihabitans sp. DSM 45814]
MNRPSWLDLRLIAGVLLVLTAVLVGAFVVSSADHRMPVWALTRNVSVGTVLRAEDLKTVRVQLGSAVTSYVSTDQPVSGRQVTSPIAAGELLGQAELIAPEAGVSVVIPVRPEDAPKVAQGDRVSIWVSTKSCRGLVLLRDVAVQDIKSGGGGSLSGSATMGILVRLTPADAQRVIGVLDLDGTVIRIGVLSSTERPAGSDDDLTACAGPAR